MAMRADAGHHVLAANNTRERCPAPLPDVDA